jgi:hypothetical protein
MPLLSPFAQSSHKNPHGIISLKNSPPTSIFTNLMSQTPSPSVLQSLLHCNRILKFHFALVLEPLPNWGDSPKLSVFTREDHLQKCPKMMSKADSISPKTKNVRREDPKNDEREIALTKYRSTSSKCYPRVPIPFSDE